MMGQRAEVESSSVVRDAIGRAIRQWRVQGAKIQGHMISWTDVSGQ